MPKAWYQRRRSDGNQQEIVDHLRAIGCTVQDVHALGHGFPDILVGWRGRNYLFEIKTIRGKITPDEKEFAKYWKGQVALIRTFEQAVEYIPNLTMEEE